MRCKAIEVRNCKNKGFNGGMKDAVKDNMFKEDFDIAKCGVFHDRVDTLSDSGSIERRDKVCAVFNAVFIETAVGLRYESFQFSTKSEQRSRTSPEKRGYFSLKNKNDTAMKS